MAFLFVVATVPSQVAAQEEPRAIEPCAVETPASGSPWRSVRADGFTFCVPSDWVPSGKPGKDGIEQREWRFGSSSITWNRATYVPERVPFTVTRMGTSPAPQPVQPDIRRMSELIGGGTAEMWLSDSRSSYRTGAVWNRPTPIYFLGKASRREQAQLQLDIFRTVRFALPDTIR